MKIPKRVASLLAITLVTSNVNIVSANTMIKSTNSESLVGAGRVETAIEISKSGWEKSEEVVLVNESSISDAVCATPFADVKNAPVLLSGKSKISNETKEELKRLGVRKVYLIGGENALSKDIENELNLEGINIDRIYGNDRYKTSLEIAKRLNQINPISEIAIADGYKGLVDAVSIGAVAANKNMPVILSNNTNDIKEFIKDKKITNSYIIGGENSISKEIEKSLPNPIRIYGEDRSETNAKVIEAFYSDTNLKNVYVAKDGSKKVDDLIDSLAVGALAAKNNSPIIVVGNKLSEKQKDIINTKSFSTITKVGGNGNENAFKELEDIQKSNTYEVKTIDELNEVMKKIDANDVVNFKPSTTIDKDISLVNSNAITINLYGKYTKTVNINMPNGDVTNNGTIENIVIDDIKDGTFINKGTVNKVVVNDKNGAAILNDKNGKIKTLNVEDKASGVNLSNNGKMDSVNVKSGASDIVLRNKGTMSNLKNDSEGTKLVNNGTINKMEGSKNPVIEGNKPGGGSSSGGGSNGGTSGGGSSSGSGSNGGTSGGDSNNGENNNTSEGIETYEVTTIDKLNEVMKKVDANDVVNFKPSTSIDEDISLVNSNAITINLYGTYTKTVTINMPNSDVTNNGTIENIVINDIKDSTFINKGTINTIVVNDNNGATILNDENRNINIINVEGSASGVKLINNGNIDSINVKSGASGTVITNNGTISNFKDDSEDESNGTIIPVEVNTKEGLVEAINAGKLNIILDGNITLDTPITLNENQRLIIKENNILNVNNELIIKGNLQVKGTLKVSNENNSIESKITTLLDSGSITIEGDGKLITKENREDREDIIVSKDDDNSIFNLNNDRSAILFYKGVDSDLSIGVHGGISINKSTTAGTIYPHYVQGTELTEELYPYIDIKYENLYVDLVGINIPENETNTLKKGRYTIENTDTTKWVKYDGISEINSIAGNDICKTSALIAGRQTGYDSVILVNNSSPNEEITASGLSGVLNAPILMTEKNTIPESVKSIINKDTVKNVYIIGGEGKISENIEGEITKLGKNIERIGGTDRIQTSYLVAREMKKKMDVIGEKIEEVILINGFEGSYIDAMNICQVASKNKIPIILTDGENVPSGLLSKNIKAYVIGGSDVMSDTIVNKTNAERLAGIDRYETNEIIINKFYRNPSEFYIVDTNSTLNMLIGAPLAKNKPIVQVGLRSENSNKEILKYAMKLTAIGEMSDELKQECINATRGYRD